MNQRSKRAWIENVAWTLVVSMSVLQLMGGGILRSASAGLCVNAVPDGPAQFSNCAGCSDGSCGGDWIKAEKYNLCGDAAHGYYNCRKSTWKQVQVGTYGDCVEQYSVLAIVACAGGGALGGAAAYVTACAVGCAPTAVGGPPAFGACMSLCLGYTGAGALGGLVTSVTLCLTTCACISRCVPGPAKAEYVPALDLDRECHTVPAI
jgi:hypothetical protein